MQEVQNTRSSSSSKSSRPTFRGRSRGERHTTKKGSDLVRTVIHLRRVSKTVRRGRVSSLSACVVVGDNRGKVCVSIESAKEAQEAVRKAFTAAESRLKGYPMRSKRTVPHDTMGYCGAVQVLVRRAPVGTGIIAGNAMKNIFEALGLKDVVGKVIRGQNPINIAHATIDALQDLRAPRTIALDRHQANNTQGDKE